MFNLSTVWNIEKYEDPARALAEIETLGFDGVELSWVNEERWAGMKGLKFKAASIHSFMPEPMKLKEDRWRNDVFRLTSLDPVERKEAVRLTKRTIDIAADYGAGGVVVHLGHPENMTVWAKQLFKLFESGRQASEEFLKLREAIKLEREKNKGKYMEQGLKSLEEINSLAVKKKVKIGLETRMHYEELPGIEEFEFIFREFSGGSFKYWHDIGHAESQERLGFLAPDSYLNGLKKHLLGLHIHDMKVLSDHRAPGTGDLGFEKYLPFFKDPAIIKVFEVHPFNTKEEVINGRKILEELCSKK